MTDWLLIYLAVGVVLLALVLILGDTSRGIDWIKVVIGIICWPYVACLVLSRGW